MDNKRDANMAGLSWPSTTHRGTSSTSGDPQTTEVLLSTSTPSATTASSPTPNVLSTTPAMETYSGPPPPAVPFPTPENPPVHVQHHTRFTSRVVHQIHFKVFTHSNNARELFVEEIPTSGISKCRDPEHYFYALSGSWEWSQRTSDYWRHHFEIPLLHGHHPFHNIPIETTAPHDAPDLPGKIRQLAKQVSDTLTEATTTGAINDPVRMVSQMSFHDAIQILQDPSNFPSE